MAGAIEKLTEAGAFLEWCAGQEGRYELLDGHITMMTGATKRHDRITGNTYVALRTRLRTGPCRPFTADLAVRTQRHTVRRPDVTVDCEPGRDDSLEAEKPVAVFEVLSPSTRGVDLVRKLEEYRALPGLRHIVLLEQAVAMATVFSRSSDGADWTPQDVDGLEGELVLAAIGVSLPMAELYEDIDLSGA